MTGLVEFYALLKEVQKLSTWVLPTAGVAPVVAALAGLSPPWPERAALAICTSLAVLVALVFVFQLLRRKSRRIVNTTLVLCVVVLVILGVLYLWLMALLVYTTPVTKESFVQGFECSHYAAQVFKEKCPWLDLYDMKQAKYESTVLWTPTSIASAKLVLVSIWIALFGTCATLLGAFVSHQSKRKSRLARV